MTAIHSKSPRGAVEAFRVHGKSSADSAGIGGLSTTEMDDLNRKSGPHLTMALMAMAAQDPQRRTGVKKKKALLPRAISVSENAPSVKFQIRETEPQN